MLANRKIENIYLWGTKVLVFLIPFLPLYVSTSMVFPYITGKNFAFRILTEISAVFWIGLIIINKKYRPHSSAIVLSLMTFTFIVGVADLFGINPYNSFWSSYERMEGYITVLHLALYFIIIRTVLQSRKDWLVFFNIILLGSFFVSLYALSTQTAPVGTAFWMEYRKRIYGTVGNPPFLAAYMLLTIFIGFIVLFNSQRRYLQVFYVFLVFLNAVAIYRTATRGAILSGLIAVVIMGVFYISSRVQKQKWKLINIAIAMTIVACSIIVVALITTSGRGNFLTRDITLSRFATVSSSNSIKARLNTWEMAWKGFRERPLLGWGQENFIGIYTVNAIPFKGEQIWADRAHDIVLEWLINAGILGLLSYLSILGSALYVTRKKYLRKLLSKKETVTIMTALIVYVIQNLFTFDTINTYFLFFALIAYIDNIGTENDKENTVSEKSMEAKNTGIKSLILTLLSLFIVSIIFYFVNYKPIEESRRSLQISKYIKNYESFGDILRDFKDALTLNTFGDNDVIARMDFIAKNYIISDERFSDDGALKFLKETVIQIEKGILRNQYSLEYLTGVIELYNKISFYEPSFSTKAESLINWCIRINPQYEWLYYALADTYKINKKYTRMFEIVNNMAALDPANDQKQLKLALAAIFMKKEKIATRALGQIKAIRKPMKTHLSSGKDPFLEMNELYLIAKAYGEIKDFQKAIAYLKQMAIINPNQADIHYTLATAYLDIGDKICALEEAKKAAKLNPFTYGELESKIIDSLNK